MRPLLAIIAAAAIGMTGAALAATPASGTGDLADRCPEARNIALRTLRNAKLESVCGSQSLDANGRRAGRLFLNFTGQNDQGERLLMSLTLELDGSITGESDPNNPRVDTYGHHRKPDLQLEAWFPVEEAVVKAVSLHPGHGPVTPISLSYAWWVEFGNRAVMVIHWVRDGTIYFAAIDARTGQVLQSGENQAACIERHVQPRPTANLKAGATSRTSAPAKRFGHRLPDTDCRGTEASKGRAA